MSATKFVQIAGGTCQRKDLVWTAIVLAVDDAGGIWELSGGSGGPGVNFWIPMPACPDGFFISAAVSAGAQANGVVASLIVALSSNGRAWTLGNKDGKSFWEAAPPCPQR